MKRRIIAFLLAAVMVFGMMPTIALAEDTAAETSVYEALVANNVTVDGSLAESNWFTGGKLSGGQAFDILWDGGNLYFAVEAGESDTALTVTVGETALLTAEKNGTDAIEAKVAYTTKDVTTIENVTLAVGESTWTGNVSLVKMARTESAKFADMPNNGSTNTAGSVTATADGEGLKFAIAALDGPNSQISTVHIMKSPTTTLVSRTVDTALEFTLDPTNLPVVKGVGTVGQDNSIWAGLEVILVDDAGDALHFGIGNAGDNGLFMNVVNKATVLGALQLGKKSGDEPFAVKALWKTDSTLEVFVDGVSVGTVSNVTVPNATMDTTGYTQNNMVHIRATRYDYNETNGHYTQALEFTMSDIRLCKAVEVVYALEEDVVATGTHEALVASDIVLDGALTETAWLPYSELGLGQDFDVLFDGGALYFGVEAYTGDTEMTVEIGDKTVVKAGLGSGASAFEAKLDYTTKDVTTIEDVTITVGQSVWTGSINLVSMARVTALSNSVLTTLGSAGDASKPVETGNGYSFSVAAGTADHESRAYAMSQSMPLSNRTVDMSVEFDFDPTGMTEHSYEAQVSSTFATTAGFTSKFIDENKQTILFGISSISGKGLVFVSQTVTWGDRVSYELGRTAEDGAFRVRLDWGIDGNLDLYIDGVYKTTFENRVFTNNETTTKAALFDMWRHRSAKDAPVAFTVTNAALAKAVELTYITDETKSDGAFTALFADAVPTADTVGWNDVTWEEFANGEGKAAALIHDQKVYLAVNATGAVSATLGEETVTATADGMTVLAFENTAVTAYGEELVINVSLDDVAVWNADGKLTVGQAVVGGSSVLDSTIAVIKTYNTTTNAEDNSFTMISDATAPMYNNSNCAYWIYNKADLANAYEAAGNNLVEQTITVNAMPIGSSTGTYNSGAPNQGWGYTTMFEFPSATTAGQYEYFSSVLYPDAETNLYLTVMKSDGSINDPIALGKKIGDTFKLGILCAVSGSQTIYVDGVEVGSVADGRKTAGATYKSAIMLKYMDPVTQTAGSEDASITIKDVTVTKIGAKDLVDLEDEITSEAIFGALDLTNVTANLPLVTTFQSAYLGERTLTWASSNEDAVETNGNIHPSMTKEQKATLTVYLDGSETALWSVDVVLPPSSASLDALLSETEITVDGNLYETAWLNWKNFTNPAGNIAAAWTKGNLYFAVSSAEADTLKMSINEVAVTVDLVNGTISGAEGATIAKNAKTGVIEIGMPLTAINFNLTDYNQNVLFKAELVDGDLTSELNAMILVFTGTIAEVQKLSSYTKDNGPWTLLTDSVIYNGEEPGKVNYVYKTNCNLDHTGLIVLSTDFQFDALPITDGNMSYGAAQAQGFYYYFSDEDSSSRKGTTICAAIFTEDGTNLKIRIGQGQGQDGYVFDLGKTLGEQFRVTHYWYADNSMDLYVDGVLIGNVSNAGYATSYLGVDVITYRYYSEKVSTEKVKFTIFNQTRIVEKYETVLDELTQNVVFGRIDLEHVQKNLPMVTTFASANFAALNLKWTSSDESVVAADGTITRDATEEKSAVITVYFVDEDGTEIELWSVTVTVDPMSVTKQPAPAIIHTGFAAPGSITIDGVVETEENWLLNGWVLNDAEQPVAYFGAQWDEENLYLLVDTELDALNVTVGDMTYYIDMVNGESSAEYAAISGTVGELKIPYSDFSDLTTVTAYGQTFNICVYDDDANTYDGTLKLTNVDWWGTDNIYAGLPMLANNVKSVKMGTGDAPDGNQGAKQLENGWRLFDVYDPEGENPAGIRTYVLFMKMPVYENFADRTEATHIEFDFCAKSLPVGEWDEGLRVDSLARAFANYGVTFSLSDKADSGKNSNVAVFGITNTADGLVMVVNRGSEDYAAYPLNKQVGEEFRLGLTWLTNSNLVLSIDGEEFITIEGMSKWVNSVGDTSFVVNMLRNKVKPTSEADNMDVYLTNIAFGKAHSQEDIIRNLTFEDFAGQNESESDILYDLELPAYMTNGQLSHKYPITWTSSDEATIDPATGKVTRPEHGVKFVTLTATLENNGVTETKSFDLIVMGQSVDNGNTLVYAEDVNPFTGAGYEYNGLLYNLDETNNSIIYVFPEDAESTKVNLVTLTDLDQFSRLNRRSLRLFYSNDNVTYTEIEDYKLHHDGCNWYLYNFDVEARYIKVHFTHRDYAATDFFNTPGEMIHAAYDQTFVIPANAAEIDVPTTILLDEAATITLPEGVEAEGLRVALNGEILFHFVEKNGSVVVRIPDPTTGKLQLWNGEGIDIADKENVYEVTYGTTETHNSGARWILSVKAGTTFPNGTSVDVDTLFRMNSKSITISTDGGYTWQSHGSITFSEDGLSSGGWGIDSKTGRLFHEFYGTAAFQGNDITKTKCITYVFYSDDGGKTWTKAEGLGQVEGDLQSNYVLSYTDLTELSDNDGEGPNVDFVFPMGAQYNNSGAFCGRVAYTVDGGLTWSYSASKITYGNETAFEGGVSEATILEREDGTLVYYARCQSSGVDNFTISYSLDHGVTWLTPGATSSIYTTNTQALMMTYDFDGFDGSRLTGTPMFMWGGNNVLGGNSYQRMPLNFAISTNGMDTFREIQNIFFGTFQDVYTTEADHYITNPSIQQVNGDDMYLAYSRLYHKDSVFMVVNDFTDWFLRTKGAYDSFEKTSALGEGWRHTRGTIEATNALAAEGDYSLMIKENTQATRSVPYIQNGSIEMSIYADASSNYVIELQPAYSVTVQKCAAVSVKVSGTTMILTDGTEIELKEGWNTIVFWLSLQSDTAAVTVNHTANYDLPVDLEAGDYVTYLTILATSNAYVDELLIVEDADVVIEATRFDKESAENLVETIKALEADDADGIQAALETYKYMTQVQQDLVNRRVPTGTSDNANDEGALINWYEYLLALAEGGAEEDEVFDIYGANAKLGNDLSMNFYVVKTDVTGEGWYAEIVRGESKTIIALNDSVMDGDYYKLTYPGFAAKEMVDEVTVTIYDAEGNVRSNPWTDSLRAYAMRILSREDATDSDKTLMVDMLNYGAAAQTAFSYKTDDLANNQLTDEQKAYATESIELADNRQNAVNYYGTSLNLKSNIQMNLYFTNVTEDMTAEITYTNYNGVEKTAEAEVVMSGIYGKVTVENMVVADAFQLITVTVKDADGNVVATVTDSVESYCYRTLAAQPLNEYLMKFAQSALKNFEN